MPTILVIIGSLLIVAGWEFGRPRRQREFPALRRRFGNLGFWIANVLLAAVFFEPVVTARPRLEAVMGIALPSWPLADGTVSMAAGFVLLDLAFYAVHRCEHRVPLLWRFHALHHSDPDVDVTTAVRHHPLEYLFTSAVYWLLAIVLDIPVVVVLVHGLAVFGAAAVQHGNIRLPEWLERRLQPVLMTTDLHRVHHSVSPDQANANYGAVFSFWDRLFGTRAQALPAAHDNIVFGVRELPRRDCLKPSAMLLTPWRLARVDGVAAES